jgi:nitroreductase
MTSVMTWFQPIVNAPTALLVLGDPTVCTSPEFWTVDCAAFTQNVLLAARSLGLGTVWCGIAPNQENIEKIRSVLEIPAPLIPFCAIAIGHPASSETFKVREFDDTAYIYRNPDWLKN